MVAVTIRTLPEATHRSLKLRAAEHGRSTEAEIRAIIETAVRPSSRVKLGTFLAKIGKEAGLTDDDVVYVERDKTPAKPVSFE